MKNNSAKPRIVLDTNVLVSALVFGGVPRQITDLIAAKTVVLVMSEEIMTELRRVVGARFPRAGRQVMQLEKLLHSYAGWVQLGSLEVAVCRDQDDNKFLETAVLGQADYVVSGDNDLLVLKHYQRIPIIKPAEFLKLTNV